MTPKEAKKQQEAIIYYCVKRGATLSELSDAFNIPVPILLDLLPATYDHYKRFITKNDDDEILYLYLSERPKPIEPKPQEFEFIRSPHGHPYIQLYLPDDGSKELMQILPISDIHLGHKNVKEDDLENDIQEILNTDNMYTFINGDMWEFANKLSVAGGVYEQNAMPDAQIEQASTILRRLRHKLLFVLQGNHDERSFKTIGVDVLKAICGELDIPYFTGPVYADINWAGNRFPIFTQHGASASSTRSGNINAAGKPLMWQDYVHFAFFGHVHNANSDHPAWIKRNPATQSLDYKTTYVVVLKSYIEYWNSYASNKPYPPPSFMKYTAQFYRDGNHKLESSDSNWDHTLVDNVPILNQ